MKRPAKSVSTVPSGVASSWAAPAAIVAEAAQSRIEAARAALPAPAGFRGRLAAEGEAHAPDADLIDARGLAARRLDARPGTSYLLRPDQHVCARWRRPDEAGVRAALQRACGAAATA